MFRRNISNQYKLSRSLEALSLATTDSSNQLLFNVGTKKINISVTEPTADRTYTIPDFGSDANFVLGASDSNPVNGPSSSTDNSIARFDGTTGSLINDSSLTISDTGTLTHSGLYANTNTTDSSSTTTGAIVTSGGIGLAKNIRCGDGIYLKTSGGTASKLNYYEQFKSVNNKWSGPFASDISLDIKIARVGNIVVLSTDGDIQGTSSSAATITSTTGIIPSRLRPVQNFQYPFRCVDSGTAQLNPGLLTINSTTGTITISKDLTGANFSSSGTCGLSKICVTWIVV